MSANVSAVLFDYGMVLSGPPDPAAKARMIDLLSTTPEAFHEAYWPHREAYDRGALTGEAYWHEVATDLGRTLSPASLAGLLSADTDLWTQPNHDMIDWAAALQAAGIRTGILSNIGDSMEAGILAKFPWLHHFTHHTFSHRLKIAKPDAAIYAHAANGLGVAPEEILFVDDREENIAAALAAGMKAAQYNDHPGFVAELERQHLGWLLSPTSAKA